MSWAQYVLVVAIAAGVWADQAPLPDLRNVKVIRKVSLMSNEAVQKIGVHVVNDGDTTAKSYRLTLSDMDASRLAECTLIVNNIAFESACSGVLSSDDGYKFVDVAFPKPLAPGNALKFRVQLVFIHVCEPLPKAITQGTLPYVVTENSAVLLSPYPTDKQTTTFRLGTRNVLSFSEPGRQVKDNIEYGPFENISALSTIPVKIHFMHDKAFATVTKLIKEIEVSHWGNVAVEEHYLIRNDGPLLKGEYSRLDYDSGQVSTSGIFQWLVAHLPPHAQDLYYRDSIGNVSTSRVRPMKDEVHFEMATRFPIMGGWTTDFYFGFNIPSVFALYNVKSLSGKKHYVLNMPFGTNLDFLVVDEMIVRVILPEGSTNIKWEAPFIDVAEERGFRRTYLDTIGRPMLELRKKNVVSGYHGKAFQVTYSFDHYSLLREPLLLFTGFFLFFMFSVVYSRIKLFSFKTKKKKTE